MAMGHKRYFVIAYVVETLTNGCPCGRTANIGNVSTIRAAKSVISRFRRENQHTHPQDFCVYDCWAEVDPATNFVPCVYHED